MLHARGSAILSDCSKTKLWVLRWWPTGIGLNVSLYNVLSAVNMVQKCAKSATRFEGLTLVRLRGNVVNMNLIPRGQGAPSDVGTTRQEPLGK